MLTGLITLAIFCFYKAIVPPRVVNNRPGYWMALRWARWFAWQAFRGKVDFRQTRGGLIWEAWPGAEVWRNATAAPFTLLKLALFGVRFRMDQTDYMTAMEVWPDDQ